MMSEDADVTILVNSVDTWACIWLGFCHFWHKFWPDCPWPIRFLTNERDPPCGKAIKCGPDWNFTAMLRAGLPQVETPYLLLIMADCWPVLPIDSAALLQFASYLREHGVDHIRLQSNDQLTQGSSGSFGPDPRLFIFSPEASYRVCLQPGLWNVQTLAKLLHDAEGPWEFETRASARSKSHLNLCIDRSEVPDRWNGQWCLCYHNIVSGGHWNGKPINDALEPDVRAFIERYG